MAEESCIEQAPVTCGFSSPEERDEAIISHMSLVRCIAKKIQDRLPRHIELGDLVSAGTFGLIDAANRYDPAEKNASFATFAYSRIRGEILDSLRDEDFGSRDVRKKAKEVDQVWSRLAILFGRKPTESEMASTLQLPLDEYRSLLQEIWMLSVISAHDERHTDEPGERDLLLNLIPDKAAIDAHSHVEREEAVSQMCRAVKDLPQRQQSVIMLYYYEEMSMKQIGSAFGINESSVSKTHAKALLNLKASMLDASRAASGLEETTLRPEPEYRKPQRTDRRILTGLRKSA
jgi:RNA polymerase sigma factor for flagellar operon FliA